MPKHSDIIYSTDPDFKEPSSSQDEIISKQDFRVMRRKIGGGKMVTLVSGFRGREGDLKSLGKKLRSFCSAGGSVKQNEILIQGDHRDKVVEYLRELGHSAKPSGG